MTPEQRRRALELHGSARPVTCGECGDELAHLTAEEQDRHMRGHEQADGAELEAIVSAGARVGLSRAEVLANHDGGAARVALQRAWFTFAQAIDRYPPDEQLLALERVCLVLMLDTAAAQLRALRMDLLDRAAKGV